MSVADVQHVDTGLHTRLTKRSGGVVAYVTPSVHVVSGVHTPVSVPFGSVVRVR